MSGKERDGQRGKKKGKEGKQGGEREREKREGVNIKTARQSEVTNATRRTNQFSVVVKDNLQDIFGSSEYLVITKDAAQKTHPRRTPPAA